MSFFILNYITFLATAKLAVNWEKSSTEGCSFSLLLKISWKSIIIVRTPLSLKGGEAEKRGRGKKILIRGTGWVKGWVS